jgi:hypothetical protein
MSIPIQVVFEDGTYAKLPVDQETTAQEVIQQLVKKRNLHSINTAVLCAYTKGLEDKKVPLDPQAKLFKLYEECRSSGNILMFSLDSKDKIKQDLLDEKKRRERLASMSQTLIIEQEEQDDINIMLKDSLFKEYNRLWQGKAEMFGYMHKSGELNPAFKLRFFVLKGTNLFYYKSHSDFRAINKIDLRYCTVKESDPKKFEFDLISYKRVYHFRTQSKDEMIKWIIKIHQQSEISLMENREIDELQELVERTESLKFDFREKLYLRFQTFSNVLEDDFACGKLLEYLKKVQAHENLLFLCSVKQYKNAQINQQDQLLEANAIFQTFIQQGAECEIAIESQQRINMGKQIKAKDPNRIAFDGIYKRIFHVLEGNYWSSFKQGDDFELLILDYVRTLSFNLSC